MPFLSITRSSAQISRGRQPTVFDLFSLYRQRRALAALDAHRLNDIGVSALDAEKEANRGFWDVPDHWLK